MVPPVAENIMGLGMGMAALHQELNVSEQNGGSTTCAMKCTDDIKIVRCPASSTAAASTSYHRAQSCPLSSSRSLTSRNTTTGIPFNELAIDRTKAVDFIVSNPAHFRQLQVDLRKRAVITSECARVIVNEILEGKIERMHHVRESTLGRIRAQRQHDEDLAAQTSDQSQQKKGWDLIAASIVGAFKTQEETEPSTKISPFDFQLQNMGLAQHSDPQLAEVQTKHKHGSQVYPKSSLDSSSSRKPKTRAARGA